jgi:hypothetical protein
MKELNIRLVETEIARLTMVLVEMNEHSKKREPILLELSIAMELLETLEL